MNEKFFHLTEERQDLILNSAMEEFGQNSFKKTSADSIAKRAGVSKGLLFHYFKDKRELYYYLYEHALDLCMRRYHLETSYLGETDLFAALHKGHLVKMEMVRRHPALFRFVMRAYYERDGILSPKLRQRLDDLLDTTIADFLQRVDTEKFQEGVDPGQVLRLILRMSEGLLAGTTDCTPEDIEQAFAEYQGYADLLRRQCYKEEYL